MLGTHGGQFLLYLCRLTRLCLFLFPLKPCDLWLPRTPPRLREAVLCDCVPEKISLRAERGAGVPLFAGVTLRAGPSGVCFWLLMRFFCFFFFFNGVFEAKTGVLSVSLI